VRAGEQNLARVAAALEAAAIMPARRGVERTRRLSSAKREFYRWILGRFAQQGTPPEAASVSEFARAHGLDPGEALATLAEEDLVHAEADGAIFVAYPFSSRPRGHRVLIDNDRTVEAMCAIDALGIASMLDLPVEVTSRDPLTGSEIWVRVDPNEGSWWEPDTAVVLAGSSCEGPSFRGCCDAVNFFESREVLDRYVREHADTVGLPISIPDAVEVGRAVFGDIFKEA
jgi:hypothetical protein